MPSASKLGVGKLGSIITLSGLDRMTSENFLRISGRFSLYQIGVVRYIGGETKNWTSGLVWLASETFSRKSVKTGSTRSEIEEAPEALRLVMKLVTQATTQTSDSILTERRDAWRRAARPHWMI